TDGAIVAAQIVRHGLGIAASPFSGAALADAGRNVAEAPQLGLGLRVERAFRTRRRRGIGRLSKGGERPGERFLLRTSAVKIAGLLRVGQQVVDLGAGRVDVF